MNFRLQQLIEYKTGGKQTEFARLLGWTPQYLSKLLRGEDFGIKPILAILNAFPEVNARWMLCGTGQMIEEVKFTEVRREMLDRMQAVLDAEKYMPVMTPSEMYDFEQVVLSGRKPEISPSQLAEWERKLTERNEEMNAKFATAMAKSRIPKCRPKTVKE